MDRKSLAVCGAVAGGVVGVVSAGVLVWKYLKGRCGHGGHGHFGHGSEGMGPHGDDARLPATATRPSTPSSRS